MLDRKKYFKNYYQTHKEPRDKYNINYRKKWYPNHKNEQNMYNKKCREKLRKKVFDKLGNKCSNPDCPIPRDKLDLRALQIDHVHNNGRKERKTLTSTQYLKKVLSDTEGNYQLLCAYCNWLKQFKNN